MALLPIPQRQFCSRRQQHLETNHLIPDHGILDPAATAAVLTAALLHAGWSAALKRAADPLLGAFAMAVGTIPVCVVAMLALPMPQAAAWPWMAVSVAVHLVYFSAMALAYRGGPLAPLYALMRGTPPLLVALASAFWLSEPLTTRGWIGLALLCGGLLSLVRGRGVGGSVLGFALLSACCTATYTLLDGMGSRAAGLAPAYVAWHGALQSSLFALGVLAVRPRAAVDHLRSHLGTGVLTGTASVAGYAAVLWAMGRAPIALVAALRETSVILAALLGAVWLREHLGWRQWLATALVALGAATMHL